MKSEKRKKYFLSILQHSLANTKTKPKKKKRKKNERKKKLLSMIDKFSAVQNNFLKKEFLVFKTLFSFKKLSQIV